MRLRGLSTESAARFLALRVPPRRKLPAIKPSRPQRPPQQPKHERMPISKEQIEALRSEAERCGDRFFAAVCERARGGEPDAINACKAAVYGLA